MERRIDGSEIVVAQSLDNQTAIDFGYYSFKYSQGDKTLQHILMQMAHRLRPEWKLNIEDMMEIYQTIDRKSQPFVFAGQKSQNEQTVPFKSHSLTGRQGEPLTEETVRFNSLQAAQDMHMIFNETYFTNPAVMGGIIHQPIERIVFMSEAEATGEIALLTCQADTKYRMKGRPVSFFEKYVVQGHRTEMPIYDLMFAKVRRLTVAA